MAGISNGQKRWEKQNVKKTERAGGKADKNRIGKRNRKEYGEQKG